MLFKVTLNNNKHRECWYKLDGEISLKFGDGCVSDSRTACRNSQKNRNWLGDEPGMWLTCESLWLRLLIFIYHPIFLSRVWWSAKHAAFMCKSIRKFVCVHALSVFRWCFEEIMQKIGSRKKLGHDIVESLLFCNFIRETEKFKEFDGYYEWFWGYKFIF